MAAERQWWRLTKSPRTALVLGLVWLVVAVFDGVVLFIGLGPVRWYQVVTLLLAVLLAAVYLFSASMQRRHGPASAGTAYR